jgi:hypothetical protein
MNRKSPDTMKKLMAKYGMEMLGRQLLLVGCGNTSDLELVLSAMPVNVNCAPTLLPTFHAAQDSGQSPGRKRTGTLKVSP